MRLGIAVAIGATLSACSLLVTTSDLSSGGPGGPDGSSASGALGDASSSGDAISIEEGGASDVITSSDAPPIDSGGPCPSGRGAEMVDTGTYCIDSTEITAGQYKQFLDSAPIPAAQPERCKFTSFTPDSAGSCANSFSPLKANLPVVCINWCDARAYCEWAGKRVCHGDEWSAACTNNHTQAYPYPGDFNKNNCNGPDRGIGGPVVVKGLTTCEGGFKGLFDMAGNVTELEGDCPGDVCNRRGGSFDSSSAAKCDFLLTGPLDFHTAFVGSRCCADRH